MRWSLAAACTHVLAAADPDAVNALDNGNYRLR